MYRTFGPALLVAAGAWLLHCSHSAQPDELPPRPDAGIVVGWPKDGGGEREADAMPTAKQRMAQLEATRVRDWRSKNPYWEVVYDGTATSGDNVSGAFMWDNPIDDDWFDALAEGQVAYLDQFRLDTPARGFMQVDRTYRKNFKTGSIFRRDEWFDPKHAGANFGTTFEVRFKLLPSSQRDAFFVNLIGADCTVSVALSGSIAGFPRGAFSTGSIYGGNTNHRAFDTTTDFVTLRLVRGPLAPRYEIFLVAYANESDAQPASFAKIDEGMCDAAFKVGSAPGVDTPYFQVGDNSNEISSNAAYTLDFVRYRRDAVQPSQPLPSVQPRQVPLLPTRAPANEAFAIGYDGRLPGATGFPELGADVRVAGARAAWKPSGIEGVALLETGDAAHSDVEIIKVNGLKDREGYTIEARIRILPESGPRGFRITPLDTRGAVSMFFSPDKVELALGTKPSGFQAFKIDTTNAFHTYRLVRKPEDLYAFLYIDEDPVPAIVDQHLSAETESRGFASNPILMFGAYRAYPEPFVYPVKTTSGALLIDYIRWHGAAYAPKSALE
jgi:hypothetical protein